MSDLNYWLDCQITEAKNKEKAADFDDNIEMGMYWFGRWKALWDVKELMNKPR